ncbi:MAG: CD1107 family mobile element protein [Oscillospiraceae bacterium]
MKLEKQACMLALAAILLLIVGAVVVGFGGRNAGRGNGHRPERFEGSVILDDPVYFQEATPDEPEVKPTQQPTIEPTQAPGEQPTVEPTHEPTAEPAMDAKFTVQIHAADRLAQHGFGTGVRGHRGRSGTGFKQVKVSTGGAGWMDVTEQAESGSFDLDVYDNGMLTVRVIDRQDGYHDGTAKIMCFDRTAPAVTAGISGEPLHIETKDDLSGVAGIQVNGLLFTTLDGGKLDIHFNEVETLKSYEKLVVRAYDCAGNFSEAVTLKNPYYGQATSKPTTVPTATPRPAAKPTQKPGNSGSSSGNGTSGGGQATSQPTALPTIIPTAMPTIVPTLNPTTEPTVQPTATPEYIQTGPGQAFTGSGNMRTLDVLYSAHTNKQFISLETKSGQTYYLVIDYDKPIDEEADIYETYFLNLVDDGDLLALLSEDEKPTPTPTAAPTPTPTKEPVQTDETEPKQNGTVVAGALMLAILGGGAFWYLKQRKKKESKPQPSYDEYEDDEDDETRDDDLNE